MEDLPRSRFSVVMGGIILCILVGIVVWKILRKEKLSPVKNAVIALQGLMLFPWLSSIWGAILAVLIILPPQLVFRWAPGAAPLMIAVELSCLAGSFFGGCFAALRIKRLILFWSLLTIVWFYVMVTRDSGALMYFVMEANSEVASKFVRAGMLGLAIYGSYLGYRHSLKKADDGADGGAVVGNVAAPSEG